LNLFIKISSFFNLKNKKRELLVAGMKESMAVYVNRFFPNLFAKIVRKAKVK